MKTHYTIRHLERGKKRKKEQNIRKKCNDTKRIYVSFKFGITWLLNNT